MSTSGTEATATPKAPRALTWRKVAAWGAFGIPIVFILVMLLSMELITFFIPFIVIFGLLGLWVMRGAWARRASLIVLAILAILFIAINAPFLIPTLQVPASPFDFVSAAWILLTAITAAVGSIMALRSEAPSDSARTFWRVVAGLAVVFVAISLIATVTYDDAAQQEGDVELVTQDVEFVPGELSADAGTVTVFVKNEDPTYHTFTIDELDVSLDIPASSTARIEFEADAGEYEFYCIPHEGEMGGTLTVQ